MILEFLELESMSPGIEKLDIKTCFCNISNNVFNAQGGLSKMAACVLAMFNCERKVDFLL